MTERRRARTPSGDLRKALVDAAEAVLVREGPEAVTVRAVATEAGVAPMGVYNRFGSKDGLVQELLIRGFDGLRAAVEATDQLDPTERLRVSGIRYREFALTHPQHYALMFGRRSEQEYSAELEQRAGDAFGALVQNVATAIAAGVLREGDPQALAQQIWCVAHGAVSLELVGQTLVEPEATYAALLDLILKGLAAER